MATHDELLRIARGRVLATSGAARRIREAAGVSQRELAEVVEVAPSTLARWERGETRPRGASSVRYAEALTTLERAAR